MTSGGIVRVGCAGWSLRREHKDLFPEGGTHLERYSRIFPAVEINSSFRQDHLPSTYARWAESVPESFRFSVKVTRRITHHSRLKDPSVLDEFLNRVQHLGEKLGPLLVQLPPSLQYNSAVVETFFSALRERYAGSVVCEPRHASWFKPNAEKTLAHFRVARVAADPATVPGADQPGGWSGLVYYRLHGSPRIYYSSYSEEYLKRLVLKLTSTGNSRSTWCIFDNTAEGAAITNAKWVLDQVQ